MSKRVEEIRARLENATPGVWNRLYGGMNVLRVFGERGGFKCIVADVRVPADADFIAHAPEDIKFLLDRIATLEAERPTVEKLDAMIEEVMPAIMEKADRTFNWGEDDNGGFDITESAWALRDKIMRSQGGRDQ